MATKPRTPPRVAALVLAAVFVATLPVDAAEVADAIPRRESDWLVVDLRLHDLLDERTRSTVESGLPGSCLVEIELRDATGAARARRTLERSLEVDLWEDVVRLLEGENWRRFDSLAAADSAWSRWEGVRLARWHTLDPRRRYRLRVRILVEPLGAEERERVSRWVSRVERDDRRELSVDLGGLVQRFFGSADAASDAHLWSGPEFTPATLASGTEERDR